MADRKLRVFLSGNCQMQFVYDALRQVRRGEPGIEWSFRASYRAMRPGDDTAARTCDVHVMQVTNLAEDPWRDLVPATARRIRVPALSLPGVFHAFAPRVHPHDPSRGRPPYYLARGNRVLNELATRHGKGESVDRLVAEYLDYGGAEIENAPRLLEMNRVSMRRIAANADFDPWREIEPHLHERRFFWSVKHPTRATATLLLRGVTEMLGLSADLPAPETEYHEPYHAPIHPRLAERLGLAWAGPDTRYRFFHSYFTAAEHARRYIEGDFRRDFALNRAVQLARSRADPETAAKLFRVSLSRFPANGQADFWYGRVLQRQGKVGLAAFHYRRARDGTRLQPHPVPHRADASAATIEAWLKRCRKKLARRSGVNTMAARLARLEAEEVRLMAQIRRLDARRRLAALRAEDAPA